MTAPGGQHTLAYHQRIHCMTNRPTVNALATPVRKPNVMITPLSAKRMKCWTSAKKHSFYARDNVANFLTWCRTLGVRDVLLFESDDLVLTRRPKNVLLCLLEVARIACRHLHLDLSPTLIQLEQEIELQEQQEQMQQLDHLSDPLTTKHNLDLVQLSSDTEKLNVGGAYNDILDGRSSTSCSVSTDGSDLSSLTATCPPDSKSSNDAGMATKPSTKDQPDGSASIPPQSCTGPQQANEPLAECAQEWKYWNDFDTTASQCSQLKPLTAVSVSPQTAQIRLTNGISHMDLSQMDSGFNVKLHQLREVVNGDESANNDQSQVHGRNLDQVSRSASNSSIDTQSECKASICSQMTVSQLDQKVMLIAKNYYGKKVRSGIQRLAEGKYRIAGKIVFVRLLKDKHVMVRVGGGWDTLQHFLERHGADPVQQISVADLLPMDTRPAQCSARKRHPLMNTPSSTLSSSTITLPQAVSHAAAVAAAVAHHAAGHTTVLSNSTQQLIGLPISHLSAAVAAASITSTYSSPPLSSSSSSSSSSSATEPINHCANGSIGTTLSEINYFNGCASITPLHSSPEPASSGYCSSNNSNCTLSINSFTKITSQSSLILSKHPSSALPLHRRRSNSTISASTKKMLSTSYVTVDTLSANSPAKLTVRNKHLGCINDSNVSVKTPNKGTIRTRIPIRQSGTLECPTKCPGSPGQLQRSRSTSICSSTSGSHFGFNDSSVNAPNTISKIASTQHLINKCKQSNNSLSNCNKSDLSSRIPKPISSIPKKVSNNSAPAASCTKSISQPTSPLLDKKNLNKRKTSITCPVIKGSTSNSQLINLVDNCIPNGSQMGLRRSSSTIIRSMSKIPSKNQLSPDAIKFDSKSETKHVKSSVPSFGPNPNSYQKSSVTSTSLPNTPSKANLNVIGQTSLSAF